jgi:hypothetical protein
MYKSVAQEGIIDGFYFGPAPHSIEGVPFVLNSPLDIHAVKSSIWWVREALRTSGRPGMHLLDGGCSAIASIAATADENGLRKTDAFVIPTISELSVDYDILNKVAHSMAHGILRNSYWTVMVGGYAGGPEGAAIVGIASALNAIMVYKSRYAYVSTLMVNPPVNSARATLWVRNICIQCLNRHTAMICGGGGPPRQVPAPNSSFWKLRPWRSLVWPPADIFSMASENPNWSRPTRAPAWNPAGGVKPPKLPPRLRVSRPMSSSCTC